MERMNDIRTHAGIMLGLGIALIALGSLAIYSVVFATFATVIFFAWLLIFAGFIQFGHALYAREWSGFFLQLAVGIFALVAGILILFRPVAGAATLTLLLSFMFIAQGTLRIIMALSKKKLAYWGWILFSGILTLALGIMILFEWPYSGLYIIGLFVGIDLIFNGWGLVMLSMYARKFIK